VRHAVVGDAALERTQARRRLVLLPALAPRRRPGLRYTEVPNAGILAIIATIAGATIVLSQVFRINTGVLFPAGVNSHGRVCH
jgi:hypothetical protein